MDAILVGMLPRFIQSQILFYFFKGVNPWLFSTYATLDSSTQSYWTQSMVSTIVCTYMWAHTMAAMLELDFSDFRNFYTTTPAIMNIFYTFMGYIAFDFSLYLRHRTTWPQANTILVHHVIALTMMSVLLTNAMCPHTQIAQSMLAEITSPFVNQLYFFKTAGMKSSPLFRVNGILIVVVWFIFRVVNYTVLGMRIYQHQLASTPATKLNVFFFAIMYYMQLAWFYKILRGCLKELKKN